MKHCNSTATSKAPREPAGNTTIRKPGADTPANIRGGWQDYPDQLKREKTGQSVAKMSKIAAVIMIGIGIFFLFLGDLGGFFASWLFGAVFVGVCRFVANHFTAGEDEESSQAICLLWLGFAIVGILAVAVALGIDMVK